MNEAKKSALGAVDTNADLLIDVNDKIWEYAELSLLEYKSAALYVETLKKLGFTVEEKLAGIDTAFSGTYGSGKPVIGILAEYDALSGLSQVGGIAERKEIVPGGSGHGCGHQMLGAGSLGAAIAVKEYLEKTGQPGTVIFFGCPGEEGGAGKAFMARDGMWKHLDAAITWHPGDANQVSSGTCNSCIQKEYKFTGIAAHAAGNPHMGRSGLDAVQLMNIGVEFLREHMPTTARVHYAITDAGGNSPNVVQPYAQVLYMVRDIKVSQALALQKRVDKIAEAAAMMTETKLSVRFIDGTANTVPNTVLEKVLYENFEEIGVPTYTDDEIAYARALIATYESKPDKLPGSAAQESPEIAAFVEEKTNGGTLPINDFLMPYLSSLKASPGSTDVGDVSWQTPTAQINTATYPSGAPGHSWQHVACGNTSIGHKGMLNAARVMAAAVIDLYEKPDVLKAARAEFEKKTAEGYQCPVPPDAVPVAVGEQMR
ncbi:M20 family metallopeptidase [Eubacteriales bacterium OttesenSCG-928-A19]|nr:M20 family metallopeptidase [Eubacteriales bacterium OttesenSCG-928-A19]